MGGVVRDHPSFFLNSIVQSLNPSPLPSASCACPCETAAWTCLRARRQSAWGEAREAASASERFVSLPLPSPYQISRNAAAAINVGSSAAINSLSGLTEPPKKRLSRA